MDWEQKYKSETGSDASYEREDSRNPGHTHTWYYDDYVEWLEERLDKLTTERG